MHTNAYRSILYKKACKAHDNPHAISHETLYLCIFNSSRMPKHYPKPEFSRNEVNRAGEVLVDPNAEDQQRDHALIVINNWRASHNFPLNTFQMRLRRISGKIDKKSLVVQRIKRLPSIRLKLNRFKGLNMAQIQDIGGCRAILKDVKDVYNLWEYYLHDSRGIKHKLAREDDYISNPKLDGYRGIHLVYKYKSDKADDYDGMKIEIQMRSRLQHAWATAVETVDTFDGMSLKFGEGDPDWRRFFALMSSYMAIIEGKPTIHGTSDNYTLLRKEITDLNEKLSIEIKLSALRKAVEVMGSEKKVYNGHYFLLELDVKQRKMSIRTYTKNQLEMASSDYLNAEKRGLTNNKDSVLVSAESLEALKLAFPNYYLDTDIFLSELDRIITNDNEQLNLF